MRSSSRQCSRCPSINYCLSRSLLAADLASFAGVGGGRRLLRRGQRLFVQGEIFHSVYIVQSGSAKSYVISEDGNQQITGFHYRGNLLGVDGLPSGVQSQTIEALETSSICELLFADFEAFYVQKGELRRNFFKAVVGEMTNLKQQMLVLGKLDAEQRLAHFLLETAERLKSSGLEHKEFVLPMTRHDIANYLGLAVETISRLLTRFDSAGLIGVRHRQVEIIRAEELRAMVNGQQEGHALLHAPV